MTHSERETVEGLLDNLGMAKGSSGEQEGASPIQVLLGAARSNNLDLLKECLSTRSSPDLINAVDSVGNTALHNAARYGCLECLDYLLDQDGLDLDVANRMDGDTPLHLAIRYSKEEAEAALEIGKHRRNVPSRQKRFDA